MREADARASELRTGLSTLNIAAGIKEEWDGTKEGNVKTPRLDCAENILGVPWFHPTPNRLRIPLSGDSLPLPLDIPKTASM